MSREVLQALPQNPKGDPLEVARIAGIQAAKRTSELIPMCHPIPLSKVEVEVEVETTASRFVRWSVRLPSRVSRWRPWWRRQWQL